MPVSRPFLLAFAALTLPVSALAADWMENDPYSLPEGGEKGLDMVMVDAEAMPQEPRSRD